MVRMDSIQEQIKKIEAEKDEQIRLLKEKEENIQLLHEYSKAFPKLMEAKFEIIHSKVVEFVDKMVDQQIQIIQNSITAPKELPKPENPHDPKISETAVTDIAAARQSNFMKENQHLLQQEVVVLDDKGSPQTGKIVGFKFPNYCVDFGSVGVFNIPPDKCEFTNTPIPA